MYELRLYRLVLDEKTELILRFDADTIQQAMEVLMCFCPHFNPSFQHIALFQVIGTSTRRFIHGRYL